MNKELLCGLIAGICVSILLHYHLAAGLIVAGLVIALCLMIVLREFLLYDEYNAAYMLEYHSDKFDYLLEYKGFIMRFWCWNVKKYIDRKVEKQI